MARCSIPVLLSLLLIQIYVLDLAFAYRTDPNWWKDTKVLELTASNFYNYVGKDKHVVVDFYKVECIYCIQMKEAYEELNRLYNGDNAKRKDVIIAKMNGEWYRNISAYYGVNGYPSIMLFKAGEWRQAASKFSDYRTTDKFVNWISATLPAEEYKAPVAVEPAQSQLRAAEPQQLEPKVESTENVVQQTESPKPAVVTESVQTQADPSSLNQQDKQVLSQLATQTDTLVKTLEELMKKHEEVKEQLARAQEGNQAHENSGTEKSSDTIYIGYTNSMSVKQALLIFMLGAIVGIVFVIIVLKTGGVKNYKSLKFKDEGEA